MNNSTLIDIPKKFKYFIVNTGYLSGNFDEIKESIDSNIICYNGKIINNEKMKIIKDVIDLNEGEIVFDIDDSEIHVPLDIIDKLKECNYCACLSCGNICSLEMFKTDVGNIISITVDTEHG